MLFVVDQNVRTAAVALSPTFAEMTVKKGSIYRNGYWPARNCSARGATHLVPSCTAPRRTKPQPETAGAKGISSTL
jgi:hypothetical protein